MMTKQSRLLPPDGAQWGEFQGEARRTLADMDAQRALQLRKVSYSVPVVRGLSSDLAASAGPTIITSEAMARPVCVMAKMSA